MAGDLATVKEDYRDVVAVPGFQLRVAGDVHDFVLDPATLDDFLRPIAQVTTGLGVDRDARHKVFLRCNE